MIAALFCVVILVGIWFVASALANWEWYHALPDFAVAQAIFGEQSTRWLCAIVGLVIIVFGIAGVVQSK